MVAAMALSALPAAAQDPGKSAPEDLQDWKSADIEIVGHVLEPKQLEPTDQQVTGLKLPPGFAIHIVARGLVNPRMIATGRDGTIYVTRREVGDVVMLRDQDGNGRMDVQKTVAWRPMMHGIAIDGDMVYLVTIHDVYRAKILADGSFDQLERIVDDLPDAGQHANRMVVVGPDGKLYISVGSTCNACSEANPENATILRVEPDGSSRQIFASGLRNTIGYGFEPATGKLYGMDHGIDWLGDAAQPEELNHIVEGHKYGWPYVYADSRFNPQDDPPGKIPMSEWAAQSAEPVGLYTPARGADAAGVLHRQPVSTRVSGRRVRGHARLLEPEAAIGLRSPAHPFREWPTGHLRAVRHGLSDHDRRRRLRPARPARRSRHGCGRLAPDGRRQ